MRLSWLCAGALVGTVLVGGGCSSTKSSSESEGVGATTQAIQGGATDPDHTYAVGVCIGNQGSCFGICSGALILPNVVATARHCVDQSPQKVDCDANPSFGARKGPFNVTTNVSMSSPAGAGWFSVKSVAVPPDAHICGNDIALLVLNNAVPASIAKPIIPGIQRLMWDSEFYSPAFSAIGYGNTKPNGQDSGTRRIRNYISVLCIPGALPGGTSPACPATVNPKEFVGADGTCSGDSGSSAYETSTFNNGAPVSFGVLSRGNQSDDATTCEYSAYTRFDAHRDFVLQVAKSASNNWTLYPEPPWTAYAPPPNPKGTDAGAGEGGTSTPTTKLGLGEVCATETECASKVCAEAGDGTKTCSQACEDGVEGTCPEDFECRECLCLPPPAPAIPGAGPTTTTTTGCNATPGSAGTASSAGLGIAGATIAFGALRRRKRRLASR